MQDDSAKETPENSPKAIDAGSLAVHEEDIPTTLEDWTSWLRDKEMPIFSHTAQRLNQAIEDKRSGVSELAKIILEDPGLTAGLLKLASSPYYNPNSVRLATVTRAIVLLGLNVIRELALACSFIETVMSKHGKQQVNKEIACALHSAVQAKSLAILVNDPQPEEVFIAALLHNIGHIGFWCFELNMGGKIQELTEKQKMPAERAERAVLGFQLIQLGASLSKTWRLGGLIEEAFSGRSPRTEYVKLGYQIARGSSRGWQSEEIKRCIYRVAELTGQPHRNLLQLLQRNAESAVKLARQFGAHEAMAYIPGAERESTARQRQTDESTQRDEAGLMQIMQDITNLLCGEFDLNLVFEMVMEGIYRALRMDRVLFALLTPDRRRLKEKSALGWPPVETRGLLQVGIGGSPPNIFSNTLEKNEYLWARETDAETQRLFTGEVIAHFGQHDCCLSPISFDKKVIGLFYADRAFSKEPITRDVFDSFRQLTMQANIALKLIQAR
ncbi:HDOD domain-containing protein [Methylocaldum sp.]|uniref:HDOD domain-containing protein n=1 Tax=Methylocaldum sp. TaxID=1969727 RepID=UPI002D748557|nr:HDOD domain-containing protein [Methylocaldum sp.]HYE35004.1 HDOD domain-containing protein [Methylocaldum sp.]